MKFGTRAIVAWIVTTAILSGGMSFIAGATGRPAGIETWLPGAMAGMLVAVLVQSLSVNRAVAVASDAERQAALAMSTPPGKAMLYVFRSGFVGRAVGIDLSVDGRTISQLKSPRFTCVKLAPGAHRLGAAVATGGAPVLPAEAEFTAEAGGVVAFRCDMALGAMRNSVRLVPVSPAEARAAIERTRMVRPDLDEV